MEAGRAQASYVPTDLAALTRNLASAFQSAVESAGLRLVVDCPPLPEPIYVDPEMWEKVVLNLLSNAVKYTHHGEIRVSLAVAGRQGRPHRPGHGGGHPRGRASARLRALLPRPCHPGPKPRGNGHWPRPGAGADEASWRQRLGGEQARRGDDLHLAAAARLGPPAPGTSRAHAPAALFRGRGRRRSSRRRSAGPRRRRARFPPAPRPPRNRRRRYPRSSHGPASSSSTTTPTCACTWLGCSRASSSMSRQPRTGDEALELARAQPPDLVLSDVMMPGLDGFGLVRALRAEESTRAIPIILLSARAGEEPTVEGLESGADDYLVKPFSARELMVRVRTQLDMARVRRQVARSAAREASPSRVRAGARRVPQPRQP